VFAAKASVANPIGPWRPLGREPAPSGRAGLRHYSCPADHSSTADHSSMVHRAGVGRPAFQRSGRYCPSGPWATPPFAALRTARIRANCGTAHSWRSTRRASVSSSRHSPSTRAVPTCARRSSPADSPQLLRDTQRRPARQAQRQAARHRPPIQTRLAAWQRVPPHGRQPGGAPLILYGGRSAPSARMLPPARPPCRGQQDGRPR
jgi:hypothetical protein